MHNASLFDFVALPFAIGSIALAGILFYLHPKPVYCMRVQRAPPLRMGLATKDTCGLSRREWGSLSTNRKQIARRRSGRLACEYSSTVVDISIPPPSFKPLSLYLSHSPLF